MTASIPWPRGHLRALDALQRHARAHRADAARAVGHLFRDVRRRLALRDAGANGIAHFAEHMFFKGTERRPTAREHRRRDRRHRRRVQRLHRQGGHRLLRQVRRRDARHRARRARRHAAATRVRRRGDRAREGRHRRGDEHVLRHAAELHRHRLRAPAVRRPAARLGHHRPQGDGARGATRETFLGLPRPLVPARAHGRRCSAAASATVCTSGWRSCFGDVEPGETGGAAAGRRCRRTAARSASSRSSPTRRT